MRQEAALSSTGREPRTKEANLLAEIQLVCSEKFLRLTIEHGRLLILQPRM